MKIEKEELLNFFKQAIAEEKRGYKFYRDASEKFTDAVAKRVLLKLAEDELSHIDQLIALKKQVSKYDGAIKYATLPPLRTIEKKEDMEIIMGSFYVIDEGLQEKKVFKLQPVNLFSTSAPEAFPPDTKTYQIMKFAIEIETKAFNLYKSLADQLDEGFLKDLLNKLAKIENGHRTLLWDELKHMVSSGHWFDPFEKLN